MTYKETLDYLYARLPVFHRIGAAAYKPGLENSLRLMEALGNPQQQYPCIHIAGTNGKGSVSHFLAAILQKSGYRTGLYTSPHLVDFGERIRINGSMIDPDFVVNFVAQQKQLFERIKPSFFEATMALAFDYFREKKIDIAIIETGLGGRLDSTNIINPILSVITNISFDHTQFLGDTLEKIAGEKAGIIKKQIPVVIGETQAESQVIFEKKAEALESPLFFADKIYKLQRKNRNSRGAKMLLRVKNEKKQTEQELSVGLSGDYQLKNVGSVLCAVDILNDLIHSKKLTIQAGDKGISDGAIREGLEKVCEITGFQGRWQILGEKPQMVADTGHNEAGMRQLKAQLERQTYEQLHIVIGMVNDKDIRSMLALLPSRANYYFTQASTLRALAAENLQVEAKAYGLTGEAYDTVESAIQAALSKATKKDFVCITGSNFVVGEALEVLSFEKKKAKRPSK